MHGDDDDDDDDGQFSISMHMLQTSDKAPCQSNVITSLVEMATPIATTITTTTTSRIVHPRSRPFVTLMSSPLKFPSLNPWVAANGRMLCNL